METAVAYYKDGVPYDDKGQVIITLLNDNPDGSGSGSGGGTGGSNSESSAAIQENAGRTSCPAVLAGTTLGIWGIAIY